MFSDQIHIVSKWWSQNLNPRNLTLDLALLATVQCLNNVGSQGLPDINNGINEMSAFMNKALSNMNYDNIHMNSTTIPSLRKGHSLPVSKGVQTKKKKKRKYIIKKLFYFVISTITKFYKLEHLKYWESMYILYDLLIYIAVYAV